jgi:hypothetical protein
MNHARNTTLVVLLLSAGGIVAAQGSDDTTSGVAACARLESSSARLDCYDELARTASRNDAAAGPPPADPTDSVSRREAKAADRQEREQTGQVASIRELQPGRIEVTLTNGQVWRQTNSDRYNLLVGHEVLIYPSGFGKYFRLSSPELGRFIQVERVK